MVEGAGSPSNTMWPGPRLTCMPSFINHLATIHQRYRQTDRQTGQTDSTDNGLIAQGEPFYKNALARPVFFAPDPARGSRYSPSPRSRLGGLRTPLRHPHRTARAESISRLRGRDAGQLSWNQQCPRNSEIFSVFVHLTDIFQ